MVKVLKRSSLELAVDFEEIFDGASVEEATQKAHSQKMPSEFAKANITDNKLISANIKLIGEENDELKK
jgi:hypothetical protein|nr:hypothetical protein [uncultured Mediterranean phage uvMED]BAR18348.1 hypothetical protein [uncultured Mediterranean phage uvMED]|tara:strand:- start:216 stop:422 length:207 start_codon:yes stop_codon:yes gene_type:complete